MSSFINLNSLLRISDFDGRYTTIANIALDMIHACRDMLQTTACVFPSTFPSISTIPMHFLDSGCSNCQIKASGKYYMGTSIGIDSLIILLPTSCLSMNLLYMIPK